VWLLQRPRLAGDKKNGCLRSVGTLREALYLCSLTGGCWIWEWTIETQKYMLKLRYCTGGEDNDQQRSLIEITCVTDLTSVMFNKKSSMLNRGRISHSIPVRYLKEHMNFYPLGCFKWVIRPLFISIQHSIIIVNNRWHEHTDFSKKSCVLEFSLSLSLSLSLFLINCLHFSIFGVKQKSRFGARDCRDSIREAWKSDSFIEAT